MKLPATIVAAACAAILAWPGAAHAQSGSGQGSSSSSSSSKSGSSGGPQDSSSSSSSKRPPDPSVPGAAPPAAPDGSDPISRRINNSAPAQHDVEVGQYYMKREKWDAAIDRFKDAVKLLPDYGLPYKLMGESYEKKKFLQEAAESYQKYLTFDESKKDAEDVRKRISRLQGEIQEQQKKREAATKQ